VGVLGSPHPDRARGIGIGVARPLVETPALGFAVGQDCVVVAGLFGDVGELCETDVEGRLDPIARRLGLPAERGVGDIVEVVQVAELPVGNFGAGVQNRHLVGGRLGSAGCERVGLDRTQNSRRGQESRGGEQSRQDASLKHAVCFLF
jgi:hypothetical protein